MFFHLKVKKEILRPYKTKHVQIFFIFQKALIRIFNAIFFTTKVTFVNSQHKNTNSKGDFVFKPGFKHSF